MIDLSRMRQVEQSIRAGILMERGPLSEQAEPDVVAPFCDGATIYYGEGAAIAIGGFHYLAMGSVVAWEEAPS